MAFLATFSIGYSLFITKMASGTTPGAVMRFTLLNAVFGIVSTAFATLFILVLSRRLRRGCITLQRPRWAALILVSFGLFVLTRFLVAIGNVVMAAISIDLYRNAFEAPSAILRLVLFPFLVWRVALARGARTPGLGQISAQVWTGQSGVLGLVLLFAAVSLLPEQAFQWLRTSFPALPNLVGLTVVVVPDAVIEVLIILLAIISFRSIEKATTPDIAEVFA